jgi:major membrane immunogen (membrane-anchored lipoprotein)
MGKLNDIKPYGFNSKNTALLVFKGIVFLIGTILLSGCAQTPIIGGPLDSAKLVDGIYEGSYKAWPNMALVKVEIKDNTIVRIEIVEHRAWKGRKSESIISQRIIQDQSTNVDAVSGATNSSRVIMNAAQKAIEKAFPKQLSQ